MLTSLIIGLTGALIGAAGPVGITWIKEHYNSKREREKIIYHLANDYWKEALITVRNTNNSSWVYPLESFIISIKYLLEQLDSANYDSEKLRELIKEHIEFVSSINELYDKKETKKGN